MAQKLRDDKIGTLSHSGGIITLSASTSSITWLTIGGQQYKVTSSLSRTIVTDVTLTLQNLYHVYAVISGGSVVLRISTNVNSVGPSGFASWKLIGAFYTNTAAAFSDFVSKAADTATTVVSLTSGSTYTSPTNAKRLKIRMVGAGGSGGRFNMVAGSAGGNTTFGTLTAGGGGGGNVQASVNAAGAAGGALISTSMTNFSLTLGMVGQNGASGWTIDAGAHGLAGEGGNTPFGFGGRGGHANGPSPVSPYANSGAGGGADGDGLANTGGSSGGGAGAYIEGIVTTPAATYSYTIGIKGGNTVHQGADGYIEITEFKPNLQDLQDL